MVKVGGAVKFAKIDDYKKSRITLQLLPHLVRYL